MVGEGRGGQERGEERAWRGRRRRAKREQRAGTEEASKGEERGGRGTLRHEPFVFIFSLLRVVVIRPPDSTIARGEIGHNAGG